MAFAATIGFFDGVHTGHRFVLERLQIVARENGLDAAVIIFEEHPQHVLRGSFVPLLTTFNERVELLKKSGIEKILPFRFEEIHKLTAEEFMRLLHEKYDVNILLMGYDHHFGSDKMTMFSDYETCANRVGMHLFRLPQNPSSKASSTAIRYALLSGEVEKANALLGYPYTLEGAVIAGKQIGRMIGFPTANLKVSEDKLIPATGVYVCEVDGRKAVMNIGNNPTVDGTEVTVELHLVGYKGDLYGKSLAVRLLHYLRPERKFENMDALRQQIELDVAALK